MEYKKVSVIPTRVAIEYKKLDPKDFERDYEVKNGRTTILTPDDNGYIATSLSEHVNLQEKNTVVINSGVGQGKSTACINIAKSYLEQVDARGNTKYVVVFVAPFITLINQYFNKLVIAGVEGNKIFNYLNVNPANIETACQSQVHLITINSLLGNYGESGFMQMKERRAYLNGIINHCEKKKKKVVFIFDEIHDSIHNFQEKFIFNLWKWYYVIHKSFILSATFTESSKVVIKYLADLTNDKIHLLESKREKLIEGHSKLHLCFINDFSYSPDDEFITEIIKAEYRVGKKVHILSFSEKLATNIATPKKIKGMPPQFSSIGQVLLDNSPGINLCTSITGKPFDEAKCNVGTTFKTGISIEGNNNTLIIITPQFSSYQDKYEPYFGIFSDGITSITQAIARLRKGDNNDIFIITPTPKLLIKNSPLHLGADNYLQRISKIPELRALKVSNKFADFHKLSSQYSLLNKFYKITLGTIKRGMDYHNFLNIHIKSRSKTKPKLDYPTEDEFILSDGDRFLASLYPIFGASPAAYIVWAAYNNQFVNSTLSSIYYQDDVVIKQGSIIEGLFEIFYGRYGYPDNMDYLAEKTIFDNFYEYVTATLKVKVKLSGKRLLINAKNSSLVKLGILSIVQYLKRNNEGVNKSIYPNGESDGDGVKLKAIDFFFDKTLYIRAAVANSIGDLVQEQNHLIESEKLLTELFGKLYDEVNLLKSSIIFTNNRGKKYWPKKEVIIENNLVSPDKAIELITLVKQIRETDFFIEDDTISFCQWANRINPITMQENQSKRNEALGKLLDEIKGVFFETKRANISPTRLLTNAEGLSITFSQQPYEITKEIDFKEISTAVNVIYTSNCPWRESKVSEGFLPPIENLP